MPAEDEEIRDLRESSRELLHELRRTKTESMWRNSIGLVMLLGCVIGAAVVVQKLGPLEVQGSNDPYIRRQQLRAAAQRAAAAGDNTPSALAAWSPPASRMPRARSSSGVLRDEIQLGTDQAELKWMKQELKSTLAKRRESSQTLAVQRTKIDSQEKDLLEMKDRMAELDQDLKDEEMGKEHYQQELQTTKDSLNLTKQELAEKKLAFSKFLGMLQGTWSQTKLLKAKIDSLEAADRRKKRKSRSRRSNKERHALDDKVKQLLGLADSKTQTPTLTMPSTESPNDDDSENSVW